MADSAHVQTDKKIEEMERHLTSIYRRANKEVKATADEYFKKFEAQDKKKRELVESGELDEKTYQQWRINKLAYGKRYEEMQEQIAAEMLNANKTATAYVNGELPEVYALNYNQIAPDVEGLGGYSFTLTDAQTVKNLATKDETLLPYKEVDGRKDVRWNTQKVNSEVLQGILQGDSIPKIAGRMQNVTSMNLVSAVRNARTSVTSAECKGRFDSYKQAEKDGIVLKKVWVSTEDGRTRHTHVMLDGQEVAPDKPFKSELGDIMYPGDPTADPANIYNCRCTTIAKVEGFKKARVEEVMEQREEKAVAKPVKPKVKALTTQEKESAEWYVSGEGQWINQYLRGRTSTTLSADEKELLKGLESLTESATVREKVLYRGVDAEAVFGKMSQLQYEQLTDTVMYGEKSQQALIDKTVGKEITEKGFMSTTKDKETAIFWDDFTGSEKPIVLELEVPQGTKGYDMKQFEVEGEEQHEVLLAKGQKYKVTEIRKEKYRYEDELGEDFESVIYVKAKILR